MTTQREPDRTLPGRRGRGIVVLAAASLLTIACDSAVAPGTGPPLTSSAASCVDAQPGPRSGGGAVYDEATQHVLMLSGTAGGKPPEQALTIWSWQAECWRAVDKTGPAGRDFGVIAYDDARGRLIVYGGRGTSGEPLTDLSEWDGQKWQPLQAAIPNGASNHFAGVFDADAKHVVAVFGAGQAERELPGTWGWDGRSWMRLASAGPPPRAHYALGYDPRRKAVVLFGGFRNETNETLADLWEWNGQAWTQHKGQGPDPRAGARFAYDDDLGALVLFGGSVGRGTYFADTWSWDGTNWMQLATQGPSARGYGAMAYDRARHRLVLFGGYDGTDLGDTWEFDGSTWSAAS